MSKVMFRRCGLQTFIFATLLASAMAFAIQGWAQPKIVVQGDENRHAGEFVVPINKSQVLQLDVPFADLLVGNSGIADVLALTDRTVYILGKALGMGVRTLGLKLKQWREEAASQSAMTSFASEPWGAM